MAETTLRFAAVTPETVADFERLFEAPGSPKFCWCMVWRATAEEGRGTSGQVRRQQMLRRIADGVPVGLIGYDGEAPVAWVSVAPRDSYRRLGGPAATAGEVIWSLACMFVVRRLRQQGLAHQLIAAAASAARDAGATTLEAYPVAPDAHSYRFMGFVPAFDKAGFTMLGMAGTRRHVMRLML